MHPAELLTSRYGGSDSFHERHPTLDDSEYGGIVDTTKYWGELISDGTVIRPCGTVLVAAAWSDDEEPSVNNPARELISGMASYYCYCGTVNADYGLVSFGSRYFSDLNSEEWYCRETQVCSASLRDR